jgi:two-component system NarL family sensor kinase/two-component system sensor histidine kinase UhpB
MKLSPTPPALRDLLRVLVIVGMFWLLAMQLELSEKLADWMQSYERFQLDEMPLTLLVLSISLAWFAFRRIHEVSDLLTANRHLTQRLMSAQEDERRVLALELHDEVGQACTALRIEAAYITKAIHNNPTAALEAAQRIDQSSLRMHTLARDMLKRLRPPNLDSMGLEESLKALCRSWEQHCRIPCHTLVEALPNNLADPLCTSLYRVTQEALTNVAKHGHATQVWVSLHHQQEVLTLIITDNGQGLQRSHSSTHGLGLTGMRERIASLQGQIHFEDAQPGLRIHVQVPLAKASP